jgi:hypothetical protein
MKMPEPGIELGLSRWGSQQLAALSEIGKKENTWEAN